MFEVKIDDARYWKSCVDAIGSLIDEGAFNISKEGMSLKAMDPSGISMVSFFIPNKAFSKYSVDKETSIGLNLDTLVKVLASSVGGEQLIMKDSNNKFLLEFVGQGSRRRYRLPMIEVRKEPEKEPKIEFESSVDMKSEALKEMLKHANLMSAYIGFKADKNTFSVIAKGDAGDLEEEHEGSGEMVKKIDSQKASTATFNLDYLTKIVSAAPADSIVSMHLKTDEPMKVDYKIGDASILYYLAPYIES
ncbi:MAG: proliferating cell nuclear antigen (pcna) [Candidatus Micrarchaeaceae archaeon]